MVWRDQSCSLLTVGHELLKLSDRQSFGFGARFRLVKLNWISEEGLSLNPLKIDVQENIVMKICIRKMGTQMLVSGG